MVRYAANDAAAGLLCLGSSVSPSMFVYTRHKTHTKNSRAASSLTRLVVAPPALPRLEVVDEDRRNNGIALGAGAAADHNIGRRKRALEERHGVARASQMGAAARFVASAFLRASSQLQKARPSAAHDATNPSVFAAP